MYLVDTSVWISLLGKAPKTELSSDQLLQLAVCPPVIQEVLQGIVDLGKYHRFKKQFLALPCLSPRINTETYIHAADIYRTARKKGKTIRSSVDCLIAAIAIENEVSVWHFDRDFSEIATFTALEESIEPNPFRP